MSGSTLDLTGEEDPVVGLGHGTGALGPSDSSDSGSDIVGGPGMDEGLSDEMSREMPMTTRSSAGRDIGATDLDSDSDSVGTGERGSSGVDSEVPLDQALTIVDEPGSEADDADLGDPDLLAVADSSTEEGGDDADADDLDEAADGDVAVDDGAT